MKHIRPHMTRALPIRLDERSDRYRVCPNCIYPYMTSHRGSDFCCEPCHNEYNNKKKKENALLNKPQVFIDRLAEEKPPPKINQTQYIMVNNQQVSLEEVQQAKENNKKILNQLQIGSKGRKFSITEMHSKGFVFSVFDLKFEWPMMPGRGKYCFVYDSYRIAHTNINEVFIIKIIKS